MVHEDELQNAPALAELTNKALQPAHSNEPSGDINGTTSNQKTLEDIDVWVTSE